MIKWINVSLKGKNGKILRVLASGEDITKQREVEEELKESKRKYRLLAENTLDSIWQLDENLVCTYANPATIPITGLKSEDIVGTKLQEQFPENEIQKMEDAMKYSMEHIYDGEFTKIETSIYDKKRNLVPIEIYAKKLLDESGNFCGFQGSTRKKSDTYDPPK